MLIAITGRELFGEPQSFLSWLQERDDASMLNYCKRALTDRLAQSLVREGTNHADPSVDARCGISMMVEMDDASFHSIPLQPSPLGH